VSSLAVISIGDKITDFLDAVSFIITIGGTLAVSLFSFSWPQIRETARVVMDVFGERPFNRDDYVDELKRLGHLHRIGGPRALESQESSISDPFLRRGIAMVSDLVKPDEVREQLENEARLLLTRQESARQVLLTVGKLLPAFGLIGTLIGLVLLMREISTHSTVLMSSALSTAVLTTLYGAVFANVLVFPLAARLQSHALSTQSALRFTLEGVLMISQGESPAAIDRRLKSLIPAVKMHSSDRVAGEWLMSHR
jgi:chemotaxis protein MotA